MEEREREEAKGQGEVGLGGECSDASLLEASPGPTPLSSTVGVLGVQEEVDHKGHVRVVCAHVCGVCHVLLMVSVLPGKKGGRLWAKGPAL